MFATLTIGGVDYSHWLRKESPRHTSARNAEPDTFDFQLIAGAPKPPAGAEVIYTLPSGTRLFGGVLMTPPQNHAGLRAVEYSGACSDWRPRADAKLLNDRRVNETAGQMLVALFAKYAPEFDTSQIDLGGPVLRSVRFELGSHLTEALDKLAGLTGYVWDIDPHKKVIWQAPGTLPAPMALTDTSRNFTNLTVTPSVEVIKNRVRLIGGSYPDANPTIETGTGDGQRTRWPLSAAPYSLDQYVQFEDSFNGIDASKWVQTDVSNPTPPAGHIPSDGYLFTTLQQGATMAESGWLQIVGGNGTWGASRLQGYLPIARGDGGRRFELDVSITSATGQGRLCGFWDPNNLGALAGEVWSFFFDNGVLKPSMGGAAQTALATVNYAAAKTVRLRLVPKATAGAVLWVNTDDTGDTGLPVDERVAWRPSFWTKLFDTNTGSLTNGSFTPIFNKDFNGRADRAKVFNRLYGAKLEVGSPLVEKVLGLLNVDDDSGCDALIGIESGGTPALGFFGDTRPGNGVPWKLTFYAGIPIDIRLPDTASIAAMKAIENPLNDPLGSDGIKDGLITDPSINSVPLALMRVKQELEQFANPQVTVAYETQVEGLRAGQVVPADLTKALSGRDLLGSFMIEQVETVSDGDGRSHTATVTAGSRLKGLSEYLRDLQRAGRAVDDSSDENDTITDFVSGVDLASATDSGSVTAGPVGPYLVGFDTPPAMTFVRASVAWMFGVSYPANTPRFPSLSGVTGVLVEEGATYLIQYSEDLANAYWTKTGSSITAGVTAHQGVSLSRIVESAVAGIHIIVRAGVLTVGQPGTAFLYAKADTRTRMRIAIDTSTQFANFDLAAGTVISATGVTATIENKGGGVYLCAVSVASAAGSNVYVYNVDASNATSYTGDGVSGVLAGGIQAIQKAYPLSYFPTAGATATRAAETTTLPTTGLITPGSGTVIIETYLAGDIIKATPAKNYGFWSIGAAGANGVYVNRDATGTFYLATWDTTGPSTSSWAAGALTEGQMFLGSRWSASEEGLWSGGLKRGSRTTGVRLPVALNASMHIGSITTGSQLNNGIRRIVTYDRWLSDSEMAAATLGNFPPDFTAYINFRNGAMEVTTFAAARVGYSATN